MAATGEVIITDMFSSNKIKKTENTTLSEQLQNPIENRKNIGKKSICLLCLIGYFDCVVDLLFGLFIIEVAGHWLV